MSTVFGTHTQKQKQKQKQTRVSYFFGVQRLLACLQIHF